MPPLVIVFICGLVGVRAILASCLTDRVRRHFLWSCLTDAVRRRVAVWGGAWPSESPSPISRFVASLAGPISRYFLWSGLTACGSTKCVGRTHFKIRSIAWVEGLALRHDVLLLLASTMWLRRVDQQ